MHNDASHFISNADLTADESLAIIEATARVILAQTATPLDFRTKSQRIAYAAAVIAREAVRLAGMPVAEGAMSEQAYSTEVQYA